MPAHPDGLIDIVKNCITNSQGTANDADNRATKSEPSAHYHEAEVSLTTGWRCAIERGANSPDGQCESCRDEPDNAPNQSEYQSSDSHPNLLGRPIIATVIVNGRKTVRDGIVTGVRSTASGRMSVAPPAFAFPAPKPKHDVSGVDRPTRLWRETRLAVRSHTVSRPL